MTLICDFEVIRPTYETCQDKTLDWLFQAHAEAEGNKAMLDPSFSREDLKHKIERVGCKKEQIEKRGHMVPDYLHTNWEQMEIYNVKARPEASPLSSRSKHFESYVDAIFEQYYSEGSLPPDDIIHVSCTGYVSPSGAQKIVSLRDWGKKTTVTHAYHMGCYAAIPAVRTGRGFLFHKNVVDVVHTEVCSLHTHPADHRKSQLLSQALFADGFIKYSLKKQTGAPHFKLLAIHEEILPDTLGAMTWKVGSYGFEMILLKEIPVLLTKALLPFLKNLAAQSEYPVEQLLKEAMFAVHPGGPKILRYTQETLSLQNEQMYWSQEILRQCGNMSSATLPHIWEKVLKDSRIPKGTKMVSLAFGPGLTIVGSIMEKW